MAPPLHSSTATHVSSGAARIPFERQNDDVYTLHKLNQCADEVKRTVYALLVPPQIFDTFHIDRETLRNEQGEAVFLCCCDPKQSGARLELKHRADFPDPLFSLEMKDTPYGDLEILFLTMNNPNAERFTIDRDKSGQETAFGTITRNIPEEIRAMQAGLAPGQIRQGLRLFRSFRMQASVFCQTLGIQRVKVEPLAYHNAIMHEFYGFRYMTGRVFMEDIDREFAPGGVLFNRLDGSTPFRQPGFERSIRGRSWAIHDGILEKPWECPRMYYAIDEPEDRLYDEFTCRIFRRYQHTLPLRL